VEVPETVVHILETIEIEEKDCEALFRIALRSGERVAKSIYEHRAVGEACERILEARCPNGFP
jgi:hypothetical protein